LLLEKICVYPLRISLYMDRVWGPYFCVFPWTIAIDLCLIIKLVSSYFATCKLYFRLYTSVYSRYISPFEAFWDLQNLISSPSFIGFRLYASFAAIQMMDELDSIKKFLGFHQPEMRRECKQEVPADPRRLTYIQIDGRKRIRIGTQILTSTLSSN